MDAETPHAIARVYVREVTTLPVRSGFDLPTRRAYAGQGALPQRMPSSRELQMRAPSGGRQVPGLLIPAYQRPSTAAPSQSEMLGHKIGLRPPSFFCPDCPTSGLGAAPYEISTWYFAAYNATGQKVGLYGPFKNTYSEGLEKLSAMYQQALAKFGAGARVCAAYQTYHQGNTWTNICQDATGVHVATGGGAPAAPPPAPTKRAPTVLKTDYSPMAFHTPPQVPRRYGMPVLTAQAPARQRIKIPPMVMRGVGAAISTKTAKPLDLSDPAIMHEIKTMMALIEPGLVAKGGEAWVNDPTWSAEDWASWKFIVKTLGMGTALSKVSAHEVDGKAVSGLPTEGEIGFPNLQGVEGLGELVIAKGGLTPESRAAAFPNITAHASKYSAPAGAGVIPPQMSGGKFPVALVAAAAGVAVLLGVALYKRKR